MPRLSFRNPPVHEVVLTLQFRGRVEFPALDRAPSLLSGSFPSMERLETFQMEFGGTPTGDLNARARKEIVGWAFKGSDSTRVIQATRDSLSAHAVRPGRWPRGPYPGWDVNRQWAFEVFRELAPLYDSLEPRRAALRYLNRIAIPERSELRDWFKIAPQEPPGVSGLTTFSFGQTWDKIEGHDALSATVRLVKIAIEDPELQSGNQGALLDIEIFTRRGEKAPAYHALPDWFESAHGVENAIFDSCITPTLGDTFGRT